jgi:hypothetical protein
MDSTLGFISLDSLLSLNIDEVQAHLNSVQWPSLTDLCPSNVFYQETRAISLITAAIDSFLVLPLLIPNTDNRSHLQSLRTVLVDEHHSRILYMSNYHGSIQ